MAKWSKEVLNQTLHSFDAARDYAKDEVKRTGKDCLVVEYREKDSPDDMRFFEVFDRKDAARLGVIIDYYEVLSTMAFEVEQ